MRVVSLCQCLLACVFGLAIASPWVTACHKLIRMEWVRWSFQNAKTDGSMERKKYMQA